MPLAGYQLTGYALSSFRHVLVTIMTTTHAPAPTPKSILRGHDSQVHAAVFVRHNQRLATGDAAGFVVLWDLSIRRPTVVWRAHSNAILGIADWDGDKIITYVSPPLR